MAHTRCYNGHCMWNGDGKPEVWAFRVGFFKEYMKQHPSFLLETISDENEYGFQIYDCTSEYPEEDLDCWYCDECNSLVVFYSHYRIDFEPIENINISYNDIKDWVEYIACREDEFEKFQEFYVGKNPIEAIYEYPFERRYMMSPDGAYIYGYDKENIISVGYKKVRYIDVNDYGEK